MELGAISGGFNSFTSLPEKETTFINMARENATAVDRYHVCTN